MLRKSTRDMWRSIEPPERNEQKEDEEAKEQKVIMPKTEKSTQRNNAIEVGPNKML